MPEPSRRLRARSSRPRSATSGSEHELCSRREQGRGQIWLFSLSRSILSCTRPCYPFARDSCSKPQSVMHATTDCGDGQGDLSEWTHDKLVGNGPTQLKRCGPASPDSSEMSAQGQTCRKGRDGMKGCLLCAIIHVVGDGVEQVKRYIQEAAHGYCSRSRVG